MDNYLGELRVFAFGRIPVGWAPCDGRSLSIDQNRDLYSLLQTTYGGDGVTNFKLPDLRGRAMLHFGAPPYAPDKPLPRGQAAGTERITLNPDNLPAHSHTFRLVHGRGTAQLSPSVARSNFLAAKPQVPQTPDEDIQSFAPNVSAGNIMLDPASITVAGRGQPHDNRMPHLPMLVCIALSGTFPRED
jgi:microcystin-dependent protein